MRIAITINTSWNIYNFRKGLIQFLIKNGHKVYTIAPRDEYSQELIDLGCDYIPIALENKGTNPVKDTGYLLALYKIYKQVRPDVVLHYTIKPNIYGTLAARLLSIPVINNVSGLGTTFIRKNITARIARSLYRVAFRYPQKVFFQNRQDRDLFLQKHLINEEITDLLPGSGICLNTFSFKPIIQSKRFTFLLIARLIYDKGILEYIKAIRLLRAEGIQAQFQLIGQIDSIAKKGVNITIEQVKAWQQEGLIQYLGTTKQIQPFIEAADCVVLPSYREGTPRSLLEAASIGRPLVATNVAGCIEVVEDGVNGLLCEAKDAGDLASKMKAIYLMSTEGRLAMGKRGRKKMEAHFDEKIVINAYAEAIYQITRKSVTAYALPNISP
ncbi:MAG: glycosyltransferase family 4 protein [Thermonemataceae bacterium]